MAYSFIFDNSFDDFGDVDPDIHASMAVVLRELEKDPYYKPPPEMYLFERGNLKRGRTFCACKHVTDWGEWQMNWILIFGDGTTSLKSLKSIIVTITQTEYKALEVRHTY